MVVHMTPYGGFDFGTELYRDRQYLQKAYTKAFVYLASRPDAFYVYTLEWSKVAIATMFCASIFTIHYVLRMNHVVLAAVPMHMLPGNAPHCNPLSGVSCVWCGVHDCSDLLGLTLGSVIARQCFFLSSPTHVFVPKQICV